MATKFSKYFKRDPNGCNLDKAIMPDKVCLMVDFETGICENTKQVCPFFDMKKIPKLLIYIKGG